jgi:hypothetical protein
VFNLACPGRTARIAGILPPSAKRAGRASGRAGSKKLRRPTGRAIVKGNLKVKKKAKENINGEGTMLLDDY